MTKAWHWSLPPLAWLLGLALLHACPRLPMPSEYAALLMALLLTLALACWRRSSGWLALLMLVLAFTQGAWRSELRLREAISEAWEGRDLLIVGRVDGLPGATVGQGETSGWRFPFTVEESHAGPSKSDPPLRLPPQLSLSLYGAAGEAAPTLRAGERWQWVVRLKRPHGLVNPFGFDGELWMFEQDLRATGSVRPQGRLRLQAAPWWTLDGWRQWLREALESHVPDARVSGVLAALTLGDQAAGRCFGAVAWRIC